MIDLPPDTSFVANTPRLRLVPVVEADAPEMFVLLNDQRLHRFTGGLPLGETELADLYRRWEARRSADGREVWLNWVIRLVPLGEPIGHLQATVTDDGGAVLGWTVGSRWQGHGFAVEALGAACRLLQAHAGVSRIEAHIHPRHRASQGVATHLGMRDSGTRDTAGGEVWTGDLAVVDDAAPATAGHPSRPRSRPAGRARRPVRAPG